MPALESGYALSSEGPERDRVFIRHDIARPWWYVWGPRSVQLMLTVDQARNLRVSLDQAVKRLDIKRRGWARG